MPNASVLEKKQQQVAELAEKISSAVTGVVVDYKGITVADDTALRKELRENGVEYFVVKNTILSRAIEGMPFQKRITPPQRAYSANSPRVMITLRLNPASSTAR